MNLNSNQFDIVALSTEADIKLLCDQFNSESNEYVEYFNPFPMTVDHVQNLVNSLAKDSMKIAKSGDYVAGFSMLRGFDEGFDIPFLGIYVSSRFTKLGLAKFLLQDLISECKKKNVNILGLSVYEKNIPAVSLYEKFGFKVVERNTKNDINNIVMHYEI